MPSTELKYVSSLNWSCITWLYSVVGTLSFTFPNLEDFLAALTSRVAKYKFSYIEQKISTFVKHHKSLKVFSKQKCIIDTNLVFLSLGSCDVSPAAGWYSRFKIVMIMMVMMVLMLMMKMVVILTMKMNMMMLLMKLLVKRQWQWLWWRKREFILLHYW